MSQKLEARGVTCPTHRHNSRMRGFQWGSNCQSSGYWATAAPISLLCLMLKYQRLQICCLPNSRSCTTACINCFPSEIPRQFFILNHFNYVHPVCSSLCSVIIERIPFIIDTTASWVVIVESLYNAEPSEPFSNTSSWSHFASKNKWVKNCFSFWCPGAAGRSHMEKRGKVRNAGSAGEDG